MLLTRSDVAVLCATLDETIAAPHAWDGDKQRGGGDRVVSLSSVCLLAFCACSYLQQGQWTTLLTSWLVLELCFFAYQRSR